MTERYTFAFRASILLALLSSYAVYASGSGDGRDLGLIAVVFIAAIYWRDWRFKGFDLKSDLAFERIKRERPLFFVFGNVVESQAPEKNERDVLLDTELHKYRMHSIVAYWLLILAIGIMIEQRTNSFPFKLPLILSFLIVSPLASASHLSHFLLPLGLSLLGVVFTSSRSDEFAVGPLAIFIFSLFSALCFYQVLKVTYFERPDERRDYFFTTLKRASIAAVGFVLIVAIISKVFPKSEPAPQLTSSLVKARNNAKKPNRIVRAAARKIVEVEEFIRERRTPSGSKGPVDSKVASSGAVSPGAEQSGGDRPTSNGAPTEQPKLSELPDLNHNSEKADAKLSERNGTKEASLNSQGGSGPKDFEKPLPDSHSQGEALAGGMTEPTPGASMSPQPASSPKGVAHHNHPDETAPDDLRKLAHNEAAQPSVDQLPLAQRDLAKIEDELRQQEIHGNGSQQVSSLKGHDPKALAKTLEQQGQRTISGNAISAQKEDSNSSNTHARPSESSGRQALLPENGASGKGNVDRGEEKDKKIEAIEKKIEKVMTTFEKHSRFIMTVIIVCVLIYLFSKYLASLKPKPRSVTLSQKEKQALADHLRELRNLKLTPQQEVIETYNVVMEILNRVELGREEGIPARVHMETLSRRLPRLGEPFMNATDCFDHALYGEIEPDGKELVEFRQSTRKIFHQFDIAA